jgi:hypothetical protein
MIFVELTTYYNQPSIFKKYGSGSKFVSTHIDCVIKEYFWTEDVSLFTSINIRT